MSDANYTITFVNYREQDGTYALCMGPPQLWAAGRYLDVSTLVWQSNSTHSYRIWRPRIDIDNYAWVGTGLERPAPAMEFQQGMGLPAQLGNETDPGSAFDMTVVRGFPVLKENPSSDGYLGSFRVWTGTCFTVPNDRYWVGLGKINPRYELVAPVGATLPLNNTNIQITPNMQFGIIETVAEVGSIVDFEEVSKKGIIIDFTSGDGASKQNALVWHQENGRYKVEYE